MTHAAGDADDPPKGAAQDPTLPRKAFGADWGAIVVAMGGLSALAAVIWSSSLPLWLGVRVYSEQVLLVVLGLSLAMAFLGRRWNRDAGGAPGAADIGLAALALVWAAALTARFPVIAENVFYHPTEALIFSGIGLPLLIEGVRRTLGWSLLVILGVIALYAMFADQFSGPLQSRAIKPERLLTFLVLDSAALAGAALYIAVAVVFPFL
ncbi:MAG: hypothetical protein AAFU61_01870, partial [Pseudomonadota bacterium]